MRRCLSWKPTPIGWTSVRRYSCSPGLSAPARDSHSIHIASEQLCGQKPRDTRRENCRVLTAFLDDILERLAPSFSSNGPIDIIDLYPGTGLFSTKINTLLSPRRHILLEPHEKTYLPHLKPLLERSSRYTLLPWDPLDENSINKLFSPEHLPEQLQRDLGPKGACQANPSLLVLANLTRHRRNYATRSITFFRHLETCLDQTLFHQFGLVRMITMFAEKDARTLLPRALFNRRRWAVLSEAVGSELVQLTGDTLESNNAAIKGGPCWEQSVEETAARAKAAGILTASSRQPEPIEKAPAPLMIRKRPITVYDRPKQDWHDKYLEYYEEWRQHKEANPKSTRVPDPEKAKRFTLYRKRLFLENRQVPIIEQAASKNLAIDSIRSQLRTIMDNGRPYPARTTALVSQLDALVSERQELYSQLTPLAQSHAIQRYQESQNLTNPNRTARLLFWDRRPYEPLRVQPTEFHPQTPCALLDFHPNPSSPMLHTLQQHIAAHKPRDAYLNIITVFQHLLRAISRGTAKAVDRTLLRPFFPGRSVPELVRAIPSLRRFAIVNASYCGERLPENLQLEYGEDCLSETLVRVLPAEVLWDIALEWDRWPMKPVDARDLWKLVGGHRLNELESTFTSGRA
ncbi:predicted protein [Uncinocarpus reesii 1704]|uniref:Uncharacterized protein n=1 Tax=Uncinocarpus reesii (strain UAMH 1704) TaxID=336963 RepID=C4JZN8_UNCRE|nr:uncharacterized protein UREG_07639 [Uncinocarpus reesii 1704]EEP82774.1 predicted protein [Uncinocarpus reesii 1704]